MCLYLNEWWASIAQLLCVDEDALWLRRVEPWVKGREDVSTQVKEHLRLVYIVFVCENAFFCIGFDYFSDENGVVASFELVA